MEGCDCPVPSAGCMESGGRHRSSQQRLPCFPIAGSVTQFSILMPAKISPQTASAGQPGL